ncbi:hypothetical protein K501DRAFT_287668 [Backusella circina FSU 941]|nr:hypothetical protein K501DRAFT_287668 [Backusella circina FSU 941]
MSFYEPETLDDFKEFINENSRVVVNVRFPGSSTTNELDYLLNRIYKRYPSIQFAQVNLERMHSFSSEYDIGMPVVMHFKDAEKIYESGTTDAGALEHKIQDLAA